MTKAELKPLYTEAAVRARSTPSASELAVWLSQLGAGDIRDLKSAIDAHFEKSSWMPKESELKPLMEQARHARRSSTAAPRSTYARWRCEECGTEVGGYIEPSDYRRRKCNGTRHVDAAGVRVQGPDMVEIFRQENFRTGNRTIADAPFNETEAA